MPVHKISKYWSNFSLLVVFGALLMLPFVPFAKLRKIESSAVPAEAPAVLASSSVRKGSPVFSRPVSTQILSVSFNTTEQIKQVRSAASYENQTGSSSVFKVFISPVQESSASYNFRNIAYFKNSGKDTITLKPGEFSDINVIVEKTGASKTQNYIISILNSR